MDNCTLALEYWRKFSLPSRLLDIETLCDDMRESKSLSIIGRKRLNDTTKVFRSKPPNEQLELITDTLRAYQEEVDQLSRRSKYSEGAFYNIFKDLQDAPDPIPFLEELLTTYNSDNHQELTQLKKDITQYEDEFKSLKNQDVTIRNLEEKISQLELNSNETTLEETILQLQHDQHALERRYNTALENLHDSQSHASRTQHQLLSYQSQTDIQIEALKSERDLLLGNTDRELSQVAELNRNVKDLEKRLLEKEQQEQQQQLHRNELLLHQQKQHQHQHQEEEEEKKVIASGNDKTVIVYLQREIDSITSELNQKKKYIEDILVETSTLQKENSILKLELDNRRPMEEELQNVRRQANLFKRIAFNEQSDSDNEDIADENNMNVDVLLLARVKQLEIQASNFRKREEELREELKQSQELVEINQEKCKEVTTLVSRLEHDLEQRTYHNSNINTLNMTKATKADQGLMELLGENDSIHINSKSNIGNSSSNSIIVQSPGSFLNSHDSVNSDQMANILQGQRDRYKEQLAVVEKSLTHAQERVAYERAQYEKVYADNMSLYARIRFLQSQTGDKKWIGSPERPNDLENGMNVDHRYGNAYEEQLNPFSEFGDIEKKRQLDTLNVGDRVLYGTLSTFISTKSGRATLILYLLIMHVLTAFSLYFLVTHVDVGCDLNIDHIAHLA
jgi:homeobox protein cut-like